MFLKMILDAEQGHLCQMFCPAFPSSVSTDPLATASRTLKIGFGIRCIIWQVFAISRQCQQLAVSGKLLPYVMADESQREKQAPLWVLKEGQPAR